MFSESRKRSMNDCRVGEDVSEGKRERSSTAANQTWKESKMRVAPREPALCGKQVSRKGSGKSSGGGRKFGGGVKGGGDLCLRH